MLLGMDGYETLNRIKSNAVLTYIPVIMISALDYTNICFRSVYLQLDQDNSVEPTHLRFRGNAKPNIFRLDALKHFIWTLR